MVTRKLSGSPPVVGVLALLSAAPLARADADQDRVQFCWALGKLDHTIYYAEVANREDRQASFETLLKISSIDHRPAQCHVLDAASRRATRTKLIDEWFGSEFEVVNTTFLSDLDYHSADQRFLCASATAPGICVATVSSPIFLPMSLAVSVEKR